MTRRCAWLLVTAAAVVLVACIPVKAPPDARDPDCAPGIAAVAEQPWAEAPLECVAGGEGWLGYYDAANNKALVNAHYQYPDVERYRSVAAHEEGHAWNVHHLTAETRARYAEIRGGPEPPHGWFEDHGDVFALVIADAHHTGYGTTRPPSDQVEALCAEDLLPC